MVQQVKRQHLHIPCYGKAKHTREPNTPLRGFALVQHATYMYSQSIGATWILQAGTLAGVAATAHSNVYQHTNTPAPATTAIKSDRLHTIVNNSPPCRNQPASGTSLLHSLHYVLALQISALHLPNRPKAKICCWVL
jgi:hypothetical protein